MFPSGSGSVGLFRFAGIQVYLHWSWFLVAIIEINTRSKAYNSFLWNVLEYVALFGIVTVHEFGHALACRSVGGKAEKIVLWPLGGVAYVSPPPRPGATLWSIAAGPLVNVVLAPMFLITWYLLSEGGLADTSPNLYLFVRAICFINIGLLVFNMLPIYPLDGGQIVRSLLWYVFGRARSLMITSLIGFAGVIGLIGLAVLRQSIWLGILAAFILLSCWGGLMQARMLARLAAMPRRQGFACPACHQAPVLGAFWRCGKCLKFFDTFETGAVCPHCGTAFGETMCFECGEKRPIGEWGRG
jgi:Zn-dependent protease